MCELAVYYVTGSIGASMIVGTYLLLRLNRIASGGLAYSLLNAVGAGLVLVSLVIKFNLAAFLVEGFWVLISLFGIAQWLLLRRSTEPREPSK
jgi:hypothetical protein